MAQTFIGNLILRLQENVSAGAKKAAGALRNLDAAANQVGKSGSGAAKLKQQFDDITASARRFASVPWGANVQAQFNRLGAGAKDIDKIRASWDALQSRISAGGLTGKLKTNEIAAWRQSVVGHLTAVRAQAKSTQSAFAAMQRGMANAMKPVYTAAGLGTGAYVAGRLGRSGLTAASERQREYFRQQMSALPAGERDQIAQRSAELTQQFPSVDATQIMEMARNARNMMGDTPRGLAVLEDMVKGLVTLQSTKGTDVAGAEISRMLKGIDNLGQNSAGQLGIDNTKQIIDGLIKAVQIEGKDLDVGKLFDFARRAKIAGPGLSTDFIFGTAPAMMQDMTAEGFGTALSSAYKSFVVGDRSQAGKTYMKEQERLGLRSGLTLNKRGGVENKGEFVGADLLARNPFEWVKQHLMPALEKSGVDLKDDQAVTKAVSGLSANNNATGMLARMVTQREQIERLIGLYSKAMGTAAAPEAAGKDPFVAYQGILSSLNNLAATIGEGVMPTIVPGLNALSGAINSLASGIPNMTPLQKAIAGGYAATAGIYGAVAVGRAIWGLTTAGVALNGSAAALTSAAVALRGGAAVNAVGGAAGGAAAGGAAAGWGARLLGMSKVGGVAALIAGYYDLFSKGPEPDAGDVDTVKPGQAHNNYLEKRRRANDAFKAEQEAERERVLPWSESNREARRGQALTDVGRRNHEATDPEELRKKASLGSSVLDRLKPPAAPVPEASVAPAAMAAPQVDTASIDAAQAKAASAGAEIVKNLGVSVAPQVDTSNIQSALALVQQLVAALRGIGPAGAAAGAAVGRELRAAQSDYGVSP